VAERIATLDLVSNGRIEFGTGDSKSRMELEGFGIDADQRGAMSREALEQVANMLAMEPYPGYEGTWFTMPARNVVPKPVQRPHPPLWIACSDDATIHLAAQLGIGALAHGFLSTEEAARVVADYYETFKRECVPIGHAVNPNVAMLDHFYCHADADVAQERGREVAGFMTYSVRHYYTFGRHRPGRTNIAETAAAVRAEMGGTLASRGGGMVGTPEQLKTYLRSFQETGIDQTILLHQAGIMENAEICASMELFASEVMPEFHEHEAERQERKHRELAPYVDAAFERKERRAPLSDLEIPTVDAYGRSAPPFDMTNLSPEVREIREELERMKSIAMRLEG
jgi:alkanesulfonate monooxygenase SsuD/methylene tetrahydromethanopterin reductase-like flavin-dependent oxidoreductase (luciferase family)